MTAISKERLIVSFIGGADLAHFGIGSQKSSGTRDSRDTSPIIRLLAHLPMQGLCDPQNTEVMLFDDTPHEDWRAQFCTQLEGDLAGLGLEGLSIRRHPIELARGPTDYNSLYHTVWSAIPSGARSPEEMIFHLSSGTPAMQATLLLAAYCLPLEHFRLFETSREQKEPVEVSPPYVLAARELRRERSREHLLAAGGRETLLPNTVIDDPQAEAAYAALYRAATRQRRRTLPAPRVLLLGPRGSGKWHAARQFTHWRAGEHVEWHKPGPAAIAETTAAVLLWHLDAGPADALRELSAWCIAHPGIAVAATWRTDVAAAAPLDVVTREGLRDAEQIFLPALSARTDIVALGEAVARANGIADGKLKERLQFDLLTDVYPDGLHDLKAALAMAVSRSRGLHPERAAYVQARQIANGNEALSLLRETHETLAGLKFGEDRPELSEVLDVIEVATICYALAGGRSQDDIARLLGCSQAHVSNQLKEKINFRHWRTRLASADEH